MTSLALTFTGACGAAVTPNYDLASSSQFRDVLASVLSSARRTKTDHTSSGSSKRSSLIACSIASAHPSACFGSNAVTRGAEVPLVDR